ncbi:MAG: hypothetical protein ACR2JY_03130 [Chloroflexota bacterium]
MTTQQAARLARLYPRSWRVRYGDEFAALLEQQSLSVRTIGNVFLGALDAHARRSATTGWLLLDQRLVPWLWWILAGIGGWAGLLVIMYASFLRYGVSAGNAGVAELVSRLIIGGVLAGATVGAAQWLVIRRYLQASREWVVATTAGWCVGALLAEALLFPIVAGHVQIGWPGDTVLRGGEFGLVVGAVMGIAQWRVLRREVAHAGWWILASALGWSLGWLVGGLRSNEMLGGSDVGPAFHLGGVVAGVILAPALGGALYGIVTAPLLVALLRAREPLHATIQRRRPAAALTAVAALALLAVSAGPVVAQARRPIWQVQFITNWPASMALPVVTPQPTSTATPATHVSYSTNMNVQSTVAEAQPHLPFKVLVPATLPTGYRLLKVLAPRGVLSSPKLPPDMAWINLIYARAAPQRSAPSDSYPADALTIWESSADRRETVVLQAYPNTTDTLTIGGVPAIYFRAVPTMHAGSLAVIPDATQRQLFLSHDGTVVTIHGWQTAGIDQAALEAVAASLH